MFLLMTMSNKEDIDMIFKGLIRLSVNNRYFWMYRALRASFVRNNCEQGKKNKQKKKSGKYVFSPMVYKKLK